MRLGIYGGAFDPPHEAHLALARVAVKQLALDELRVFPTGQAWHRSERLTAPEDRIAMAKLAFDDLPRTVVDDRETRRAGPTYTIDTLRELRREFPDAQLFLVMGEDQVRAFTSWHEWGEIARIATLCVALRGQPATQLRVAGARIITLQLANMPVSATDIRERVQRGEEIASLVPATIAGYIAANHLYQGH